MKWCVCLSVSLYLASFLLQESNALFSEQHHFTEILYLQLFCLTKIVCLSLSSFVFTLGDTIQLGTVTILRFIQPSQSVQLGEHETETVHQAAKDEHPAFYSSTYVYKFMEHLVKKILPKIHVQVCQVIQCIHWQMLQITSSHS